MGVCHAARSKVLTKERREVGRKKSKKVLIFLITLALTVINDGAVAAEFYPLIPLDSSLVADFTPRLGIACDLETKNILSYVSFSYQTAPLVWSLSYGHWTHQYVPGYHYQQGITSSLCYQIESEHSLTGGIFGGTLQRNEEKIRTGLIFLDYKKRLYFDWDREIKLHLITVAGKTRESGNSYYATELELPIIMGSFKIKPWLGYSKQTRLLAPYYDLRNLVRGYQRDEILGNRGFTISFEQQWTLFPYSSLPFLELLNAVVFTDAGGVLKSNQKAEEFELYKSIGAGLALKMGEFEIRLEKVYNRWGEGQILFGGMCIN